jgi:L-type amino acid transporter 5
LAKSKHKKLGALDEIETFINSQISFLIENLENFESPFEGTTTNPGKLALAFYSGLYSFSGWSYLNYVVEEIKNPQKYN